MYSEKNLNEGVCAEDVMQNQCAGSKNEINLVLIKAPNRWKKCILCFNNYQIYYTKGRILTFGINRLLSAFGICAVGQYAGGWVSKYATNSKLNQHILLKSNIKYLLQKNNMESLENPTYSVIA